MLFRGTMSLWILIPLFALLLLGLHNGIKGTRIEWPVMPLRKRVVSVFVIVFWAAATVRVGMALWQQLF